MMSVRAGTTGGRVIESGVVDGPRASDAAQQHDYLLIERVDWHANATSVGAVCLQAAHRVLPHPTRASP